MGALVPGCKQAEAERHRDRSRRAGDGAHPRSRPGWLSPLCVCVPRRACPTRWPAPSSPFSPPCPFTPSARLLIASSPPPIAVCAAGGPQRPRVRNAICPHGGQLRARTPCFPHGQRCAQEGQPRQQKRRGEGRKRQRIAPIPSGARRYWQRKPVEGGAAGLRGRLPLRDDNAERAGEAGEHQGGPPAAFAPPSASPCRSSPRL